MGCRSRCTARGGAEAFIQLLYGVTREIREGRIARTSVCGALRSGVVILECSFFVMPQFIVVVPKYDLGDIKRRVNFSWRVKIFGPENDSIFNTGLDLLCLVWTPYQANPMVKSSKMR